jgi:molybdopterin adenylyltransferase
VFKGEKPFSHPGSSFMSAVPAKIGILTVSDRASAGIYKDVSGPAIRDWLARALSVPFALDMRVIPDGFESVRDALIDMADVSGCCLVLTTGGTGPAPRDLTPEATLAACSRELPGFGELMRMKSLEQTPTAILSRQTAAHRGACLVVNLPGSPRSIDLCLSAVFPAVPYCVELIGGAWLDTHPEVVKTVRPKT